MGARTKYLRTATLRAGWLGLLLAAAWSASAQAERVHRFTASINPELTRIDVEACFDGAPPDRLVAESLDATVALGIVGPVEEVA